MIDDRVSLDHFEAVHRRKLQALRVACLFGCVAVLFLALGA